MRNSTLFTFSLFHFLLLLHKPDLASTKGFLLCGARSVSHERIPFVGGKIWVPRKDSFCAGKGPGSATNARSNQARIWLRYQCQIQSGQDPAPLLMPDPIRPRLGSATNARSNHAKTWLRYQCQIRWEARSGSHERIPFVGAKIWFPRKGFLV